VGGGPSFKTCPRWIPELALRISTRRMPREMSTCSVIVPSTGLKMVGQPLPRLGPSWTRLEELLAASEERMRRA